MRPHPELGVAKPLGRLVVGGQRFPGRPERAWRDLVRRRILRKEVGKAQGRRGCGGEFGKVPARTLLFVQSSSHPDDLECDGMCAGLFF